MSGLPDWAVWKGGHEYTLGVEEEVMLLNPHDWSLAQQVERVLPALSEELGARVTQETHGSALELATSVHDTAAEVADELLRLRGALDDELAPMGLTSASAATHPSTIWHETVVSSDERHQLVYGSMRELARREPTFALHVHVGVDDPEDGITLANRMRAHLPLLLALSVNSPFWQGRDTGLGSARTPLFQAFPRVGIPRPFHDYAEWVETVDMLIRCDAFPEPTFLWWDVRPQPRFGTVEVRILDAQTTVAETTALAALVQCIARLEITEGYAPERLISTQEVLDENRFLAARDGMKAKLIDPVDECRVPAVDQLDALLEACTPHASALGCEAELAPVRRMASCTGAQRQLQLARNGDRLKGLVERLSDAFCIEGYPDDDGTSTAPSGSVAASRPSHAG
jgi:glutamate---cysteine ligase / carboxylate-amine ligase